jgi:hypothetical protein
VTLRDQILDQLAAALSVWTGWPPDTAYLHALPCLREQMAKALAADTIDDALRAMGCVRRRAGTRALAEARMELCLEAAGRAT